MSRPFGGRDALKYTPHGRTRFSPISLSVRQRDGYRHCDGRKMPEGSFHIIQTRAGGGMPPVRQSAEGALCCHIVGKAYPSSKGKQFKKGGNRMIWKKLKQRFCKRKNSCDRKNECNHEWVDIPVLVTNRGLPQRYVKCLHCGKVVNERELYHEK